MAQNCKRCSRSNPDEANYCFFDGSVLPLSHANSSRRHAGLQPFPAPLVFPTGQACLNFDQLVQAAQANWHTTLQLLRQGLLEKFFTSLGRLDLAAAAREAVKFPDADRGLDFLLPKIPSQTYKPPKLYVEKRELDVGEVYLGDERRLELTLSNVGMGLVFGRVVSDSPWLTLGESSAVTQKVFQFSNELTIPVHVRNLLVGRNGKVEEGHLEVESNGGSATVVVRLQVAVKPFPYGALAGATTPRQIVELARKSPAEAESLFVDGSVAAWYEHNGWSYPVQGPEATGPGAVQRFFRALGLADNGSVPPVVSAATQPTVQETGTTQAMPVHPPKPRYPVAKLIIPFPSGVLGGALTTDQLARRVRAAPVQAAAFFENGMVRAWCRQNGWTYPVKEPCASGLEAVRQFLEAHRLSAEVPAGNQRPPAASPVLPFPEGVLKGASTPRQLVDLARTSPQEARALFEKGIVAAWYQQNGWKYPVPPPEDSGPQAMTRFFEAIGIKMELASAPGGCS